MKAIRTVLSLFKLGLPLLLVAVVFSYYTSEGNRISNDIANSNSEVAGVTNTNNKYNDIPKDILIIPNSAVISLDSNNDLVSLTLETTKNEDQIKSFYNDYFMVDGWTKDGSSNTYVKDNKTISLDHTDGIIKINYTTKK